METSLTTPSWWMKPVFIAIFLVTPQNAYFLANIFYLSVFITKLHPWKDLQQFLWSKVSIKPFYANQTLVNVKPIKTSFFTYLGAN